VYGGNFFSSGSLLVGFSNGSGGRGLNSTNKFVGKNDMMPILFATDFMDLLHILIRNEDCDATVLLNYVSRVSSTVRELVPSRLQADE
jgi:hypothetical protein